jgi:Ca2+-binding EF-hand superfamily protein
MEEKDMLMARMDSDESGKVSFKEFASFVLVDEKEGGKTERELGKGRGQSSVEYSVNDLFGSDYAQTFQEKQQRQQKKRQNQWQAWVSTGGDLWSQIGFVTSQFNIRPIELFRTVDLKGTGAISCMQLARGLRRIGCSESTSEGVSDLLDVLDSNRDQTISFYEWKHGMRVSVSPISPRHKQKDISGSSASGSHNKWQPQLDLRGEQPEVVELVRTMKMDAELQAESLEHQTTRSNRLEVQLAQLRKRLETQSSAMQSTKSEHERVKQERTQQGHEIKRLQIRLESHLAMRDVQEQQLVEARAGLAARDSAAGVTEMAQQDLEMQLQTSQKREQELRGQVVEAQMVAEEERARAQTDRLELEQLREEMMQVRRHSEENHAHFKAASVENASLLKQLQSLRDAFSKERAAGVRRLKNEQQHSEMSRSMLRTKLQAQKEAEFSRVDMIQKKALDHGFQKGQAAAQQQPLQQPRRRVAASVKGSAPSLSASLSAPRGSANPGSKSLGKSPTGTTLDGDTLFRELFEGPSEGAGDEKDPAVTVEAEEAAQKAAPLVAMASAHVTKLRVASLRRARECFGSKEQLQRLWAWMDPSNTGHVSLAGVDKMVVGLKTSAKSFQGFFKGLDNKPALLRAFLHTVNGELVSDDVPDIGRRECGALMKNLLFFNALWYIFEKMMSRSSDRRIDFDEFRRGIKSLGITSTTAAEAKALYQQLDVNNGGQVLFDEFCTWCLSIIDEQDVYRLATGQEPKRGGAAKGGGAAKEGGAAKVAAARGNAAVFSQQAKAAQQAIAPGSGSRAEGKHKTSMTHNPPAPPKWQQQLKEKLIYTEKADAPPGLFKHFDSELSQSDLEAQQVADKGGKKDSGKKPAATRKIADQPPNVTNTGLYAAIGDPSKRRSVDG